MQWAQENDKTLRLIQESLANTDRHLSAYLADRIDAQQIPQEAQVGLPSTQWESRGCPEPVVTSSGVMTWPR